MALRASPLVLLLAAAGAPAAASADSGGFEDLAKLESRVVAALDADVGQPGGPAAHLDKRLRLAACPAPVTIDPPALGALPLRCEALGWRMRVPLMRVAGVQPASYAASSPVPAEPPVIRRGDPVELTAGTPGFSVTAAAVAQEDGREGGRVRVRTDPRGPIIIGEVAGAGRVRVSTF